jgi:hypothetical protein
MVARLLLQTEVDMAATLTRLMVHWWHLSLALAGRWLAATIQSPTDKPSCQTGTLMARCTAHSKRTHDRCQRPAMRGRTTCYYHGGMTPVGFGLPQTKTGRYSKVIPLQLAQRYHEALASPVLLSLKDDLAVCEARLGALLQQIGTGESGQRWQALGEALDAFHRAMSANDPAAMQTHLATLRRLITAGHDDRAAWQEIQSLWDTRCRLTLTETKTLMTMQQMISTEQLMVMMGVITDTIQRAVTTHAEHDCARAILADITTEFARISSLEAVN